MSTKIYNAYRMTDVPSLYALRKRMGQLRTLVTDAIKKEYEEFFAKKCVNFIDKLAMGEKIYSKDGTATSIYWEVRHIIEDRSLKIRQTHHRDPECDFECVLDIIPIPNKVLVMAFCERPSIGNIISRQKYLIPYSYWNNTDPEEGVSEKDWNQRALPGNGIPCENGFNITLHPTYLPISSTQEVLKNIPSFKTRVKNIAHHKAWVKLSEEYKKKAEDPNSMSYIMKASDDLYKTERGKRLLKKITEQVREKIPKKITAEMFKKELK